ncbi:MAG: helix-turn-helix transcriptional regulator [Syntrophales bacterium]|nr:helix-turn-helix transcriptional regulator [Syntrophales bacterium]
MEVAMFGELIKGARKRRGIGLREFSNLIDTDASNWSKVERGLHSPPQSEEKLNRIANALHIEVGSELYIEMLDKARIDAGIIPKDILSDREVLNALPMFFRTIRSEKPTPEELERLINFIREGG